MSAYLDNSATTKPCDECVSAVMNMLTDNFGNPSSLHDLGIKAMKEIILARGAIADSLGVDKDEIINLANKIVDENLNVRAIEQASQNPTVEKKHKLKTKVKKESEYKYIEESISEKLGTKVKINNKKILISFTNNNDLNRILEILDVNE